MVETGTIKTVTITEGECSCEVDFGANDVETCVFYENVGNNNYPLPGDDVAVSISDGQNAILAVFRAIPDDLKKGEQVIYSRNSDGAKQANIKLTNSGEIDLNEGDDFAVKFNELKKGFDQLVSDFNSHAHPGSTDSVSGPCKIIAPSATIPPSSSGADISNAKVEKVKL
jgi:hypothetical protein